jgi:hypothetical protein
MVNKKKLAKKIRNKADKEWRIAVKDRDRGLCVVCFSSKLINCHHIFPRNILLYRHDINNAVCLCPLHHKWGTYSAHKNPFWFYTWLYDNRRAQFDYLFSRSKEMKENDTNRKSD